MGLTNCVRRYRDSDGTLVSILDKDDWECASLFDSDSPPVWLTLVSLLRCAR